MQILEVSCAVRPIYGSLDAKGLIILDFITRTILGEEYRLYIYVI
jgi:hypothetical protein